MAGIVSKDAKVLPVRANPAVLQLEASREAANRTGKRSLARGSIRIGRRAFISALIRHPGCGTSVPFFRALGRRVGGKGAAQATEGAGRVRGGLFRAARAFRWRSGENSGRVLSTWSKT
jgi:hypothetical protein